MTPGQRIIGLCGGAVALAKLLRVPRQLVHGWWIRGRIPAHRQDEVLETARRAGIDLTPADFFDAPDSRPCDTEPPSETAPPAAAADEKGRAA